MSGDTSGKVESEAADILIKHLSRKRMAYEHIQQMDVDEISYLKIQIYESISDYIVIIARRSSAFRSTCHLASYYIGY